VAILCTSGLSPYLPVAYNALRIWRLSWAVAEVAGESWRAVNCEFVSEGCQFPSRSICATHFESINMSVKMCALMSSNEYLLSNASFEVVIVENDGVDEESWWIPQRILGLADSLSRLPKSLGLTDETQTWALQRSFRPCPLTCNLESR
jgi:hypothetical protein